MPRVTRDLDALTVARSVAIDFVNVFLNSIALQDKGDACMQVD